MLGLFFHLPILRKQPRLTAVLPLKQDLKRMLVQLRHY